MYSKLNYDPLKDFVAITSIWSQPSVVMVRKDGPYHVLKDLIARLESELHPDIIA